MQGKNLIFQHTQSGDWCASVWYYKLLAAKSLAAARCQMLIALTITRRKAALRHLNIQHVAFQHGL